MAKRVIKSKNKLSRPGGLATVALLALAGIVAVVLVRAGGAGPQSVALDINARNDGTHKSGFQKSLKAGAGFRTCFTLENTQSELAPNPEVVLYATTKKQAPALASISRGSVPSGVVARKVAMGSSYYDPIETCIEQPLVAPNGELTYGLYLTKGGNVQVSSVSFNESVPTDQAVPQPVVSTLDWNLNPAPIRGFAKLTNFALLKKGFSVRACISATGVSAAKGGDFIFKIGTKSKPGVATSGRVSTGSAKSFCAKPTFVPTAADLMYEIHPLPGSNIKVTEITLQTVDDRAPSAPASLSAQKVSGRGAKLTWPKSTDNVGVKGYNIYRQIGRGKVEQIGKTSKLTFTDKAPSGSEVNIYYVAAYDAAGNTSGKSPRATFTDRRDIPQDRK